jgi:large subunit ribosomal protein L24
MALRIRKDDRVIVRSGSSKTQPGQGPQRVLSVDPEKQRALVEGTNVRKRHMRARSQNQPGGIVEREMPIHLSNLALYCDKCKRGVRFGVRFTDEGEKHRFCKKCDSKI